MKIVIQRVKYASVSINNQLYNEIQQGYLIFLGIQNGDTQEKADWLIKKITNIRIFEDEQEKMNLSIQDIKGEILLISQFTLYGDLRKGNRPSFDNAMKPNEANILYEYFVNKLKETNIPIKTGCFGAYMNISLLNDGPVTFVLEK